MMDLVRRDCLAGLLLTSWLVITVFWKGGVRSTSAFLLKTKIVEPSARTAANMAAIASRTRVHVVDEMMLFVTAPSTNAGRNIRPRLCLWIRPDLRLTHRATSQGRVVSDD